MIIINWRSDLSFNIPVLIGSMYFLLYLIDRFSDPLLPRTTQILLEYNAGKWVPRLREPRDLYGLSPTGRLHLVRWPQEFEVIREKIHHIGK